MWRWRAQPKQETSQFQVRERTGSATVRRRRPELGVTILESRRLLSTPTLTDLGVSAGALTYGQQEVLTATVTTNPPSATTPSGGMVSFMDGATVLDTESLGAGGIATFTTTALPAGSDVISAAYDGDSDYGGSSTTSTLTISQATPAIAWTPPTYIVYGTPLTSTQLDASSPIAGSFVYNPAPGTILNATNSQTLTVTFTPDDSIDYTSASDSVNFFVVRATLTVTAESRSMIYGADVPSFGYSITGFVAGDTASVVSGQAKLSTTASSASPVGIYPIITDVTLLSSPNYVFGGVDGLLTVDPAMLTVSADNESMTYGGELPALGDTITGFQNGDTSSVISGNATLATSALSTSPVGTYPITINVSNLSTANYTFAGKSATLTINPAPLVITAGSFEIRSGQPIPELGVSYQGFVNGETSASLTRLPSVTTTAIASSPPGFYPIVPAGATAANYAIAYVDGSLLIDPMQGGSITTAPATVEGVSIQKVKTGKHKSVQTIVVQLSEAMNATDAQSTSTYALATIPAKKKQKSKPVAISRAVYTTTATGSTVTIYTKKPLALNPPLLLSIKAADLLDELGRPLDGNGSGQTGANFVATLRKTGVIFDSARTAAAMALPPSPDAVDSLLRDGSIRARSATD
jgi:hypothetical protein